MGSPAYVAWPRGSPRQFYSSEHISLKAILNWCYISGLCKCRFDTPAFVVYRPAYMGEQVVSLMCPICGQCRPIRLSALIAALNVLSIPSIECVNIRGSTVSRDSPVIDGIRRERDIDISVRPCPTKDILREIAIMMDSLAKTLGVEKIDVFSVRKESGGIIYEEKSTRKTPISYLIAEIEGVFVERDRILHSKETATMLVLDKDKRIELLDEQEFFIKKYREKLNDIHIDDRAGFISLAKKPTLIILFSIKALLPKSAIGISQHTWLRSRDGNLIKRVISSLFGEDFYKKLVEVLEPLYRFAHIEGRLRDTRELARLIHEGFNMAEEIISEIRVLINARKRWENFKLHVLL